MMATIMAPMSIQRPTALKRLALTVHVLLGSTLKTVAQYPLIHRQERVLHAPMQFLGHKSTVPKAVGTTTVVWLDALRRAVI